MKISDNLRAALVLMACCAMLSPMATFGVPPQDASGSTAANAKDTRLGTDSALIGKVVDALGNPVANASVTAHQSGQQQSRTNTNAKGEFRLAGLQGGVYQITCQGKTTNYRVWTANAAPPAATDGVLLVDYQSAVTRGQCGAGGCGNGAPPVYGAPVDAGMYGGDVVYGGDGCCEQPCPDPGCGDACCGGGGGGCCGCLGFLSSPWVIGAGVAAAIAIPLALDDDDDNFGAGSGNGAS